MVTKTIQGAEFGGEQLVETELVFVILFSRMTLLTDCDKCTYL